MNNYFNPNGASLYGNYRTRTFADIWEEETSFSADWEETPFATALEEEAIPATLIFYLLYARYGNSNVASSDENRFKYQLFSIIFQYAPTWQKELDIQKQIRALSIDDFRRGNTNIVNNAANPSGAPSADTNQILTFINNQNVSKTERSVADGYALMLSLLKDDVTESFLKRFQKLFLNIVQPELPLWYETTPDTLTEE